MKETMAVEKNIKRFLEKYKKLADTGGDLELLLLNNKLDKDIVEIKLR